jgi:hypothetical protein
MPLIVSDCTHKFRRNGSWHTENLPVPVDLLIYTEDDWVRMRERFAHEVIWLDQ